MQIHNKHYLKKNQPKFYLTLLELFRTITKNLPCFSLYQFRNVLGSRAPGTNTVQYSFHSQNTK